MYYPNNFQAKYIFFLKKKKALALYYQTCGQLKYFINILIQ